MDVAHTLGAAGRSGRVEPERAFVGGCFPRAGRLGADELVFEGKMPARIAADDEDDLEVTEAGQQRRDHGHEFGRHEQRLGTRILENDLVIVGRKQRVDRNGYDSGLDAAPEDDGKIGIVQQDHGRPVLRLKAVPCIEPGHPGRAVGKSAVGQRPSVLAAFHECRLGAPPLGDVTVDEIDRSIAVRAGHRLLPCDAPAANGRRNCDMMHIRGGYGKKVAAQAGSMERPSPIPQPAWNYSADFLGSSIPRRTAAGRRASWPKALPRP